MSTGRSDHAPARGPSRAAWRSRLQIARHSLGRAAAESLLRLFGLVLVALVVLVGTHVVFRAAFTFLHGLEVVGPVLLARLLSLFFFLLFVMLVMSNVLVAFQTLYRSREVDLWATAPLPARLLVDARGPEVSAYAGWAFVALGVPLLLAYASATGASAWFVVVLPLVLALFATVASAVGILATLLLVRTFPGLDWKRLAILIAVAAIPVGLALVRAFRVGRLDPDADLAHLLVHALEGLGRSQYPFLPGHWAAETLRAAGSGDLGRMLFFTWALAITAVFVWLLARAVADRTWLIGFQLMRGRGVARPALRRRRARRRSPARGPRRALARKDVRVFLRDPMQWSQVALVAVLALVYVVNLRHLPELSRFALWGDVAAALNAGVVMLLLATLATRFAFPLISLEGRRAWIVLMAPLPRRALVTQKLLVAFPLLLVFGLVANEASSRVLGVAPGARWLGDAAVAGCAFAVAGLATGLGALFPNFREDNPARIVSGLGGTLCFLASASFVILATLLSGAPRVAAALERVPASSVAPLEGWALLSVVVLSAVAGWAPVVLGRRHFERLEP